MSVDLVSVPLGPIVYVCLVLRIVYFRLLIPISVLEVSNGNHR